MFGRHKVSAHFRTKLDEYVLLIGDNRLLSIAVDENEVQFYTGQQVITVTKSDAIHLLSSLTGNMQNILDKLKE